MKKKEKWEVAWMALTRHSYYDDRWVIIHFTRTQLKALAEAMAVHANQGLLKKYEVTFRINDLAGVSGVDSASEELRQIAIAHFEESLEFLKTQPESQIFRTPEDTLFVDSYYKRVPWKSVDTLVGVLKFAGITDEVVSAAGTVLIDSTGGVEIHTWLDDDDAVGDSKDRFTLYLHNEQVMDMLSQISTSSKTKTPRHKMLKTSDISVEPIFPGGGLRLTTIVNGERISMRYYAYSKKEAVRLFKKHVQSKQN